MTIANTATALTDDEIDRLILDALADTGEELIAWPRSGAASPAALARRGIPDPALVGRPRLPIKVKGRNYVGLASRRREQINRRQCFAGSSSTERVKPTTVNPTVRLLKRCRTMTYT